MALSVTYSNASPICIAKPVFIVLDIFWRLSKAFPMASKALSASLNESLFLENASSTPLKSIPLATFLNISIDTPALSVESFKFPNPFMPFESNSSMDFVRNSSIDIPSFLKLFCISSFWWLAS